MNIHPPPQLRSSGGPASFTLFFAVFSYAFELTDHRIQVEKLSKWNNTPCPNAVRIPILYVFAKHKTEQRIIILMEIFHKGPN